MSGNICLGLSCALVLACAGAPPAEVSTPELSAGEGDRLVQDDDDRQLGDDGGGEGDGKD